MAAFQAEIAFEGLKRLKSLGVDQITAELALEGSGTVNPLNAELNPICHLLALLAQNCLHVSRLRVKSLTLRLLMSYGAHILDVSRSHTTTHHSR
jgi:hypothetical protein